MLPPLPRCSGWAYSSLIPPSRVSLPQKGYRVGLHIVLFEACSAFTHVAACTLAPSPYFVTRYPKASDMSSPPCLLRLLPAGAVPGGICTHWKAPPSHGAHPKRTQIQRGMPTKDAAGPHRNLSVQIGDMQPFTDSRSSLAVVLAEDDLLYGGPGFVRVDGASSP
jgi:hypothetical protein